MSTALIRSYLRVGQAVLAVGVAMTSLCAASMGCGDTVANNEGACVAQTSAADGSGCDATKESYYTCPGARVPTLDAGTCTLSKVHGGFCCPLPTQAGNASQNGQIVDIITSKGVSGATIVLTSDVTGTSDSAGNYVLQVKQNTPFNMVVNAPNYAQLTDQEWQLTGDFNLGPTHLVPASLQAGVYSGLPGYDNTKATLGVGVEITGACADNAGAVITFGDPNAKIMYFKGTTPFQAGTSVQSGSVNPSALIYNIDPASTAKVTVAPPAGCTNIPYPYTAGTITYTGNYKLSVGNAAASFFRAFLQ